MKFIIWAYYERYYKQFYFETSDEKLFRILYKHIRNNASYGSIRIVGIHGYLYADFPCPSWQYYKQV